MFLRLDPFRGRVAPIDASLDPPVQETSILKEAVDVAACLVLIGVALRLSSGRVVAV